MLSASTYGHLYNILVIINKIFRVKIYIFRLLVQYFIMAVCFLCRNIIALNRLWNHFKYKQQQNDIIKYICCEADCSRSFNLFSSFERHVQNVHFFSFISNTIQDTELILISDCNEPEAISIFASLSDINKLPSPATDTWSKSATCFFNNDNNMLPRNVVQSIINNFDECITSMIMTNCK